MLHRFSNLLAVLLWLLSAAVVQADVFNMPAGQTSLLFVPVGNPGNASDPVASGSFHFGAVAYSYDIGKYDVTNSQYAEFLAAKATTSDPYGLWNSYMTSDAEGGITRSGSGPYTYAVKPGQGNQPVVDVTWYDTVRFANWLTNGQTSGDTESGTYAISGSGPNWTVAIPSATQRATWAATGSLHYLLPSENEWYKAAYYDPTLNGGSGGYWQYPTQSNTAPISEAPPGGSNSANFYDATTGYALTGSTSYDSSYNYLTDVGAYTGSLSAYGTFDQAGDVWQWNETVLDVAREVRGGSWKYTPAFFVSSERGLFGGATFERSEIGFRVASVGSVPEPGSVALLSAGILSLSVYFFRRRHLR